MGIFNKNKKKEPEQENLAKKPIYTKLSTMNKENNNINPFVSETILPQEKEPLNLNNLDEIRKEVEETKNIMKNNIITIENRGENLDNLQDRAQKTEKSAKQFKRNAKKTKNELTSQNIIFKIFIYTTCFLIAFFCTYGIFFCKDETKSEKIIEAVCLCFSTLCLGYLAVNDSKYAFNFCLEKISCCNKDSEKEQSSDQTQPLQV